MGRNIEEKLNRAGYSMIGTEDIEGLIIELIKTNNERYLKAIPYLIYLHKPNIDSILSKTKNKKLLRELITITGKIFTEEKIPITLPTTDEDTKKTTLNYEEFKQEFRMQKQRGEKTELLSDKERIYSERNTQLWLSQLFTTKEKEIILKLFDEQPLTKTEYEYYSRKTKKKLNAIANLQELARALLPQSPKREAHN